MFSKKRTFLLCLAIFVLITATVCLGPSLAPVQAAATHLRTIDTSAAGGGARVLLGDVTGNGRIDIVMMQPDYMTDDRYIGHEIQALTAYDVLGNQIWQIGTPDSRVTNNGTDIPAQIYDIDDDGYNEVLACMNNRFRVFDGATGAEEYSFPYPNANAHDAIAIADFAGDGHPSEIVLKDRYNQVWALSTPSGSVRWTYSGNVGHYPWPYDFDGDGRDELMAGFDLLDDNGQWLWTASGMSDHADSMWVADFNQDGYPDIVLGGSDTGAYERNGNRLWLYTGSVESQQVVVGDFRTDIAGLETAGLDRIDRSSNGLDGLFILSNTGQEIWKENRTDRGCYGTIIDMIEDWDSMDRLVAWNRGCQKPYVYVYNGYGSVVSTLNVSGGRVMHADVCGDYHEEMFLYVLGDRVEIYSNGGACDLTQTTGSPLPQIKRLYNYTRYTAGETPIDGGPPPTQPPTTPSPTSTSPPPTSTPACKEVGAWCTSNEECCSGLCSGWWWKRCQAVAATSTPTPSPTQPGPTATPTQTPTPAPTSTPGGGGTYQAEDAVVSGCWIESNHSGYYGTGFVNFPSSDGYVEYQNVDGGAGGSTTLRFRFALGATSARTGQLRVNGVNQNITFDPTGAWNSWAIKEVVVTLNSGTNNTIRLSSTGQDLANQDQLQVID
jgi:hypothetical protein